MNSILTSIKKLLGITEEYEHFDADIVMHINSVFMTLNQLGVGPTEGFRISDSLTSWDDYMEENAYREAIKSYMYQKVRLLFDPPTSSALLEAMQRSVNEFEWRLNVAAESVSSGGNQNG